MKSVVIFLLLISVGGIALSLFLKDELFKKFGYMGQFVKDNPELVVEFRYEGSESPGMRNIVLRSKDGVPFTAMVGFEFFGYDVFQYLKSNEHGVAVLRTYCGKGPARFQFVSAHAQRMMVSSAEHDQELSPDVIAEPHWFQKEAWYKFW